MSGMSMLSGHAYRVTPCTICVPKVGNAKHWIFFKPLKRGIRKAVRLKVRNEVGLQRQDMSVTVHKLVSLHSEAREVDLDMMPSNIQATDGKCRTSCCRLLH